MGRGDVLLLIVPKCHIPLGSLLPVLIPSAGLLIGDAYWVPFWQVTKEQTKLRQVFLLFFLNIYPCVYAVPQRVCEARKTGVHLIFAYKLPGLAERALTC